MNNKFKIILILSVVIIVISVSYRSEAQNTKSSTDNLKISSSKVVDVGSNNMDYQIMGKGSPTVVIMTAMADPYQNWLPLADQISKKTKVFLYDRAGYGKSELGPFPRTPSQNVNEAISLLNKAGVKPPYLLVGHSLGGEYALIMAKEHPGLVCGLVLMEPPPVKFLTGEKFTDLKQLVHQQTQMMKAGAEKAKNDGDITQASFYSTLASEHETLFTEGADVLQGISDLEDLPLTYIGAKLANPIFGPQSEPFQKFWNESGQELASYSSKGRFILAEKSSHYFYKDDPELVVKTILEMIDQVKKLKESEGAPG